MPPSTIDAQIRARIESFTTELTELVKQAAVETVQDALGGAAAPARRRGPGRPRKAKAARRKPGRRPGRPRSTKATKATTRSGKRIRRSTEDLEALAGKVLAHVKANAGHRLEQISAGLKIVSKELKRPVATLVATKKLRTEGQKRGTRYYAGGKRKKTAAKKKASKKRRAAKKTGGKAPKRTGRKKAEGAKRKTVRKAIRKVMKKAKRKGTKKRPTRRGTTKPKVVPMGPEAVEAA
jgi:hypothetical protein